MGCSIFNNMYKPDILDEKKSLTLVSDSIINEFDYKNKKSQIIDENVNININLFFQEKNVNISPNASTTENKTSIFIKIRPKNK